jgi:Family of unknown function (DUF6496)
MARHQDPEQQATVRRVMHEFKHGELKRSRGGKVRNPKQAIAIALSEAGASNRQSPQENRRRLRQSKQKERTGRTAQAEKEGQGRARRTLSETKSAVARRRTRRRTDGAAGRTRKQLYQEAAKRNIPGRSHMNKAELARALRH